jgi:opacity protein-like surface antigen
MVKQIFGGTFAPKGKSASSYSSRAASAGAVLGGFAAALTLPAAPAAAQSLTQGPCVSTGQTAAFNNFHGLGAVPFASGGGIDTLVSAINVANTTFLTQSTAFIGAPPNPDPDQLGGGVWARGVGGQTDFKSTSTSTYTFGGAPLTGNITCKTTTKLNFAGVQIGTDVARLNVDGWNLHAGSTLGYMGTYANDFSTGGSFQDNLQIPFVGFYAAATKGGFYIDGQARWNYYQNKLTDQTNGVFGQNVDARGFSLNGNIGYNFSFADNWFVEPSVGVVWSETWVDPFNTTGTFMLQPLALGAVNLSVPGTISTNTIFSTLGRVSLRVGTSISTENWILQPFVTVSGFREFEGNNSGSVFTNFNAVPLPRGVIFTCHNFNGGSVPCFIAGNLSATNIGNYGQFGLGVVAVLPNTGWLGYVRADYRTGDHIDGWSMNGGVRYQFSPAHPVITGRSAEPSPVIVPAAYNWTGFYLGPQLGADWGYTDWTFRNVGTKTFPRFAGVLPGGQVGYNYQIDKWVFGIEGTGAWTNAHGGRPCPNAFFFTCEIDVNSLYTVTGRIGYAYWDRVLWYGKGGLAIGEVKAQARCNIDSQLIFGVTAVPGCPVQGTNRTDVGWTVGGGSEFGLTDNWSVKSETSYFNLGTNNYSFGQFGSTADVRRTGWISTIGLNYRFIPEAPVISKY